MAVAEAPTFAIDMLAPAAADTDFIGPLAPAADAATFAASTDLLAAATDASTTFIVDMATLNPEIAHSFIFRRGAHYAAYGAKGLKQ